MNNHIYTAIVITCCLLAGYGCAYIYSGFPASLYGLLILTICLQLKLISDEKIRPTIDWIIANMGICFVPAGVGIMEHFGLLADYGLHMLIISIMTTLLLLFIVGWLKQTYQHKFQTDTPEEVAPASEKAGQG